MKKVFIASMLLASSMVSNLFAEEAEQLVIPIGASLNNGVVDVSIAPSATLMVRLNLECESIKAGELARYAQKYLGTPANLLDRTNYTITSAKVAKASANHYIAGAEFDSCTEPKLINKETNTLPINITSAAVKSQEASAKQAAEAIFYIRNTRREILAGDYGEGFYGGGLGAALDQFQREEEAYAQLFFGSSSIERESKVFNVALSGKNERYVIGRFDEQRGVLDSSDMSAEPIMLQITPLETAKVSVPAGDDKSTFQNLLMAKQCRVEVIFQDKILATQTMPLFEFGETISYPIMPVKK